MLLIGGTTSLTLEIVHFFSFKFEASHDAGVQVCVIHSFDPQSRKYYLFKFMVVGVEAKRGVMLRLSIRNVS